MRIVVADRFPVPRSGIVGLVRSAAPRAQVLEFGSAADAAECARTQFVDILLCGWSTGALWRSNWLAELVAAAKPGKVVALGSSIDRAACERAMTAGAWGHIPMTSPAEVVSAALSLIIAGGTYFPAVQPGVLASAGQTAVKGLSQRQLQVLREIEEGRSNKEIAEALGISVATVKLHVQAILRTLGVRNRTAAARRAREPLTTD
jgi:DNA-binding NarL/FixJ family response regulator